MADIGYSPADVARKEVLEEAGLHVTPLHLMGVADSFRGDFNLDLHIYNLLFFAASRAANWVHKRRRYLTPASLGAIICLDHSAGMESPGLRRLLNGILGVGAGLL
jgi:ADP-ribose pyrophosphatase YjhB (NUDIX family)